MLITSRKFYEQGDTNMELGNGSPGSDPERRRTRKVRPYPIQTLEEALHIPAAIHEANAGLPFDRVLLAGALKTTPASSSFTMKLNSSAKYGLTEGGYNDDQIGITPRGEAIVAPKGTQEKSAALVEAAVQPDIFGRFYRMLAGKRLPEDTYARNMLQRELGIRPELSAECLGIIIANGLFAGVLTEVEDALYVNVPVPQRRHPGEDDITAGGPVHDLTDVDKEIESKSALPQSGRVFIVNSRHSEAVRYVQQLLEQFGVSYGTAATADAGDSPVPAQITEEMRTCTAAILVFADGDDLGHQAATEARETMLVLAGAASVLYGERVVLLVDADTKLADGFARLRSVVFDKSRPERAGLALLRQLNETQALKISA